MKNQKNLITVVFAIIFFIGAQILYSGTFKWVRIGNVEMKVVDNTDQDQLAGSRAVYYYYDNYNWFHLYNAGWHLGTKDWVDETGTTWPVKVVGTATAGANESNNTLPVADAEGITLRRYVRHQPPTIKVGEEYLNDPFPLTGDEVNPDKIPGTADMLLESTVNTVMGVTLKQKVLAWSSADYDDFIIYDWTFVNTGNIDDDDEIELPNQDLEDVYFMRMNNFYSPGRGIPWYSTYGERVGDSLRMMYGYPSRSQDSDYDDFGDPDNDTGFLNRPFYVGEAFLHADKSTADHTDDITQPRMTGVNTVEIFWLKYEAAGHSASDLANLYQVLQYGFGGPLFNFGYQTSGVYPGVDTYHSLRMDEQGYKFAKNIPWWNWRAIAHTSCGPYDLAYGDSVRFVYAFVMGTISPEKGWEVGRAWQNGTATWDGSNNLPQPFIDNPDLYDDANDYAKDCWVATGRDSLFKNAWAAQYAVKNDYNLPVPPRTPSLEVMGMPEHIQVSWGDESESDTDFSGYRVYRAIGCPDTTFTRIFECGGNTSIPVTHTYNDTSAQRAVAYFYYVTAFDNGLSNEPSPNGVVRSLESGWNLNRTRAAVYRSRPAGTLKTVRVVPNPLNVNANNFPGEPNKIVFMDIPGQCTIKIFTESGDLVKTIEHVSNSGDEIWGGNILDLQTVSNSGQLLVSGLYLAHITDTETGESTVTKFVIIR
ncbi:MAG: hypothetical protein H8E14_08365 [Candidatus Marinimicrobia bacterium]|nr:hypothetical protein [Candidatus Neomarinimicrobiota bacterium]